LKNTDISEEVMNVDRESAANKLLSMVVDRTKLKKSGWIHMLKTSEEYLYYRALCGEI
jgi:hypothetical protein